MTALVVLSCALFPLLMCREAVADQHRGRVELPRFEVVPFSTADRGAGEHSLLGESLLALVPAWDRQVNCRATHSASEWYPTAP